MMQKMSGKFFAHFGSLGLCVFVHFISAMMSDLHTIAVALTST